MRSNIEDLGTRRQESQESKPLQVGKSCTQQWLFVLIALTLMIAIAACGSVGAANGTGTSQPGTSPTPTPTPAPTASPTPGSSPTPTPNPTPSPSPTPTATPTPSPNPSPTATPTPSPTPTPGIVVSPTSARVTLSTTQAFTATGPGTPVSWSVNGIPGGNPSVGTIDANGLYTAPTIFPATNNFTVTATSQASSAVSASSPVLVVYPNHNADAQTLPIKLGTAGGNVQDVVGNTCCSGTLGALVSRGGLLYILSTNRVLARGSFGVNGEAIDQPGASPACVATSSTVANLQFQSTIIPTQASNGLAPSNVDAALAQIVDGAVDPAGTIFALGNALPTSIADAPPSATLAVPQLGMSVAKSGRTTGLTCSTIGVINSSITIDYPSFCGGPTAFTASYVGQLGIIDANFSAPGDEGSLLVTTDLARPVGMLFASNGTLTLANPIQAVMTEFSAPIRSGPIGAAIVGGVDHLVSCQPTAINSSVTPLLAMSASAFLSIAEQSRAESVRAVFGTRLLVNPAVTSITVGTSGDAPGEAALIVHVSAPGSAIPAEIDGVRTRVVQDGAITGSISLMSKAEIDRATTAKEAHLASFLGQPGFSGIGVGVSKDNPAEAAVVIFTIRGAPHAAIPATLDGVRTQVMEGERFKAF